MTQYLLSVHSVEGSPVRSPEEMAPLQAAVGEVNERLRSAGAWVFAGGLLPPETATVVTVSTDGEILITDGPFMKGKEHLGGVWVIEAPDLDAALAWATLATKACGLPVEVRTFQEIPSDVIES